MKKLTFALVILAVLLFGFILWWKDGISPASEDQTAKTFVVEKGQGIREISKNLKEQGLIKNQIVFFLLTKKLGLDKQIEAGDFRISPSMSAFDIATAITHGTQDIWVTIPEGKRAEEIADILKEELPSYTQAWREKLDANEGYLFPDTYSLPRDAEIDLVLSVFKNNFDSKYAQVGPSKNGFTQDEIVKIASLIEREAKHDEDRALVASVIINRLNLGMKLDIDATIQYALGYQEDEKRWWKEGLTVADKELDSNFNTYLVSGLPPSPISNPGLASLKAAANPQDTEYLYYISDAKGINRYATTYSQHLDNIAKYGL